MKSYLKILSIITVCLFSYTFIYAGEKIDESGSIIMPFSSDIDESIENEIKAEDSIDYYTDTDYGDELVERYVNKADLLGYMDSPYISPLSSMIAGDALVTYALPYYGNLIYYGDQESPLSRFSTGITRFTTKSMAIFDKHGENVLFANNISNMLLNSLLGYFTGNIFGLNIWGSDSVDYTAGFEAIIRPFRNMAFSYSYMTEHNINMTSFEFRFGYNPKSNLAVINAHYFGRDRHYNTTTGVEWQFYF